MLNLNVVFLISKFAFIVIMLFEIIFTIDTNNLILYEKPSNNCHTLNYSFDFFKGLYILFASSVSRI